MTLEQRYFDRLMLPGDVLVYKRKGFFDRMVQIKTYGRATHTECYIGNLQTVASRNGIGVSTYEFDPSGLVAILRPSHFDIQAAMAWEKTVDGEGYDWLGLFWTFYALKTGRSNNRMFCSEHTTRFQRHGGFEPFSAHTDADAVSPADFLRSAAYQSIWCLPNNQGS